MHKSPRDLIDPNSTLPQVELQQFERPIEHRAFLREKFKIVASDLVIGQCDIVTITDPSEMKAAFDGIDINENMRGQGYGLAAYLSAIELTHSRGLPFKNQDYGQSEHAKKIWEFLAERRAADVIEPFKLSRDGIGKSIFTGRYVVSPTSEVKSNK